MGLTPAFSIPAIYSCIFHSRIFYPCDLLLHLPLLHFPLLQSAPAFSTPAFSTPAIMLVPHFPLPHFQSPRLQLARTMKCGLIWLSIDDCSAAVRKTTATVHRALHGGRSQLFFALHHHYHHHHQHV